MLQSGDHEQRRNIRDFDQNQTYLRDEGYREEELKQATN